MSLQELVDFYDSHPQHQEEIMSNSWYYWQIKLDELIDEIGEGKS